jgi:hypothetical protein
MSEDERPNTLDDHCTMLFGLALFQAVVYFFANKADSFNFPWYVFFQPVGVAAVTLWLLRTGSHVAAKVVFGYLVLIVVIFVFNIFGTLAMHGFDLKTTLHALHPIHHLKEFAELYLVGVGWRCVVLTRPSRE